MKNLNSAQLVNVKVSGGESKTCVLFFDSFGYKKTHPIAVCVDGGWNNGNICFPISIKGTWEGVFNPPMNEEECQLVELAFKTAKKIRRKIEDHIRKLDPGPWLRKLADECSVNFVHI